MTKLSVNVNKIALLRNSRQIGIPSVLRAAQIAIDAGAHGITVHPRPDQRHIRKTDVYELSELTEGKVEFNIEGNPMHGFMEIVRKVKPAQATLVPDAPGQSTSDHGWNLVNDKTRIIPIISELKSMGIRVSLFLDPVIEQVELAKECGADRVELYTEPYAASYGTNESNSVLAKYVKAAKKAVELELGINAGHDLNLLNLRSFCEKTPGVLEVSIGHALISDALELGMFNTVKAYLEQLIF